MKYRVHSAVQATTQIRVTVGGKEIDATIPAVIVELVPLDPHGKTFTHVIPAHTGKDAADALKYFKPETVLEMGEFKRID